MKPLSLFILLLFILSACDERSRETNEPELKKPVSFIEVNANDSDIPLEWSYGFDIHVNGSFDYVENYYYTPYHGYNLTLPYYYASYEAGSMPIMNTRVQSSLMCRSNECDSSQMDRSGVWYRYGLRQGKSALVWRFVSCDTENGYEIYMNEFPSEIKIVNSHQALSKLTDNIIEFEYNGTDSLLSALLVIPKANLSGTISTSLISSQHNFPVTGKENRFVIPGELIERASVNSSDTAFINLISLKRVVKVIEGKKLAVTYRKNHIHPITIN
jgi:hypothetical protein